MSRNEGFFADIADRLHFEEWDRLELAISGPFAAYVPKGDDNLVLRAARALSHASGRAPVPVRIALEKNLPVASGLGGGSADAAAALRGLHRLLALDFNRDYLLRLAAEIGSDVPVCLNACACRISGRGEIVEPLAGFRPRHAVLVNPGVALGTRAVFDELGTDMSQRDIAECRNDLTRPAIRLVPVIAEVLAELERQPGVDLVRMSGSGATCFGLFSSAVRAQEAANRIAGDHAGWWCRSTVLS